MQIPLILIEDVAFNVSCFTMMSQYMTDLAFRDGISEEKKLEMLHLADDLLEEFLERIREVDKKFWTHLPVGTESPSFQ